MICSNTKENFSRKPKKMNVKFHRIIASYTWNFQNFTCVITYLVKFDIHFLCLPWEIFFGVTTDDLLLHLKPLKNVKKNATFVKLFWYKVFPHWKLKLLSFLVDSVLSFPYHTLFVFWTFFCFLSESIDCEWKSLDFEGRTWNRGKCGDVHT